MNTQMFPPRVGLNCTRRLNLLRRSPFICQTIILTPYKPVACALKAVGAKPNKRADSPDIYTVPALSDSNTGTLITDSLDKIYPKSVFPNNPEPLIRPFDSAYVSLFLP
ncbi:hypothetical protein EDB19DRAFT_1670081, partial [Suillus lakei]